MEIRNYKDSKVEGFPSDPAVVLVEAKDHVLFTHLSAVNGLMRQSVDMQMLPVRSVDLSTFNSWYPLKG